MGLVIFEVQTKEGGYLLSILGVKQPIDLHASTLDEVEELMNRLDRGLRPSTFRERLKLGPCDGHLVCLGTGWPL